jgi:hypothetical protein
MQPPKKRRTVTMKTLMSASCSCSCCSNAGVGAEGICAGRAVRFDITITCHRIKLYYTPTREFVRKSRSVDFKVQNDSKSDFVVELSILFRSYRELGETISDHPAANCSLTSDGRIGAKKRHFEDAVPKNRCSSGKNGTLALSPSVPRFLKEKSDITSPNLPRERSPQTRLQGPSGPRNNPVLSKSCAKNWVFFIAGRPCMPVSLARTPHSPYPVHPLPKACLTTRNWYGTP